MPIGRIRDRKSSIRISGIDVKTQNIDDIGKDDFEILMSDIRSIRRDLTDVNINDPSVIKRELIREKEGIFLTKKETYEIVEKIEDKISLIGFLEALKRYRNYIINKTIKFKNKCRKIKGFYNEKIDISLYDSILEIKFSNKRDKSRYVYVDCTKKIPTLKNERYTKYNVDKNLYEKIRQYLYEYLTCIYNYSDFKKNTNYKDLYIGYVTKLSISFSDILKEDTKIEVVLKFRDFAVLNIIIEKDDITCMTFSGDNKINSYLKKNKEKLLKEIFIKEVYIEDILNIISISDSM